MNTTALPVRPDVAAFVSRVRECLSDLSEDDRQELTEGLEADLTDQVAEHGGAVLGDPEAYARELRAAAGFEPVARRRLHVPTGRTLSEQLDIVRHLWDELVARPRLAPVWAVLVALRPAWWVVRGYVAAVLAVRLVPGWYDYGLVWLPGVHPVLALPVLALCVVGSALVGLGRVWPGPGSPGSSSVSRLVLVLLNAVAIVALPVINGQFDEQSWSRYSQGYNEADVVDDDSGITNRGTEVCNIAAYDAAGQPLVGVQLFDQRGRPLDVQCFGQAGRTVPWVLGDVTRWNVFPLGVRARPARTPERRADLSDAAFPTPDRATTPEVTNPLLPEPVEPEPETGTDEVPDGKADGDRSGGGVSRR